MLKRSLPWTACLLCGFLLHAQAPSVHAQAPRAQAPTEEPVAPVPASSTVPPASEREALIEEGVRLRQEARDEQALAAFQRAERLSRDGRILAQIAFAEHAMGRWAECYVHLKAALADANDPWVRDNAALLLSELATVEANVGRLEVRTNVSVANLTVDGKEVGVTPLDGPLIVPVGSVVVSARAPEYLPTTRHVTVYARALSRVELTLVPVPSVQSMSEAAPRAREVRTSRNPAWLYVGGAGALAALSSLGPWLRGDALMERLERDCRAPASCAGRYEREHAQIERLDLAHKVLGYGGMSVALAATATYFLWTKREQPRIAPTAWATPHALGIAAAWRN